MIKVTLEYENINEAVIALAELAKVVGPARLPGKAEQAIKRENTPATVQSSTRRGRSDKGQARGSYKNPPPNATAGATPAPDGSAASNGFATVPDPGKAAEQAANPTSTPVGKATSAPVVAPEPAASALIPLAPSVPTAATVGTAAAHTVKDIQEAIGKVFNTKGLPVALQVLSRFGANTYRDVKPEQYAEFIKHAVFVSEGGQV